MTPRQRRMNERAAEMGYKAYGLGIGLTKSGRYNYNAMQKAQASVASIVGARSADEREDVAESWKAGWEQAADESYYLRNDERTARMIGLV